VRQKRKRLSLEDRGEDFDINEYWKQQGREATWQGVKEKAGCLLILAILYGVSKIIVFLSPSPAPKRPLPPPHIYRLSGNYDCLVGDLTLSLAADGMNASLWHFTEGKKVESVGKWESDGGSVTVRLQGAEGLVSTRFVVIENAFGTMLAEGIDAPISRAYLKSASPDWGSDEDAGDPRY
jgi:hypothetical protein